MELGITIEYIRMAKGLSIKEICGDFMNRSTYNRFCNGEIITSSENFIKLLNSLTITLDEFMFILNDFKRSDYQVYYKALSSAYLSHDKIQLHVIIDKSRLHYKKTGKLKYQHLMIVSSLLLARRENRPFSSNHINIIYNYLIECNLWTHYEVVLFSNSMFAFNIETVNLLLNTAIKRSKQFSTMSPYADETARLICNSVIYFIENNDIKSAKKFFSIIKTLALDETHFYERFIIQFISNILNLASGFEDSKATIEYLLSFFQTLNMPLHYKMFHQIYDTAIYYLA